MEHLFENTEFTGKIIKNHCFSQSAIPKKHLAIPAQFDYTQKCGWGKVVIFGDQWVKNSSPAHKVAKGGWR